MDGSRFDGLAKGFAVARTRRDALRALGGALALGLGVGGPLGSVLWSRRGGAFVCTPRRPQLPRGRRLLLQRLRAAGRLRPPHLRLRGGRDALRPRLLRTRPALRRRSLPAADPHRDRHRHPDQHADQHANADSNEHRDPDRHGDGQPLPGGGDPLPESSGYDPHLLRRDVNLRGLRR